MMVVTLQAACHCLNLFIYGSLLHLLLIWIRKFFLWLNVIVNVNPEFLAWLKQYKLLQSPRERSTEI